MFLYNNKKINLYAPLIIGDVQYPIGYFVDPQAREAVGIVELPDPVRPDERFYFCNENEDGSLTVTPKSVEQCKEIVHQIVTASRYDKEVGGVDVAGNMIATDRVSQSKVAGALLYIQRNPTATINWKGETGWVQVTLPTMEQIADAVGAHVQACFTEEMNLHQQLNSLTAFEEVVAMAEGLSSVM